MKHEIVILTDSRASAEFYSAPLLQLGYKVKWTSDEDRALAYIAHKNRHPDLVIIDHNPPAINGTVILLSMRELNPAIRVVIIGKDKFTKRFALANGALDFVKKQAPLKKFLNVLRNHINIDIAAVSACVGAMRRMNTDSRFPIRSQFSVRYPDISRRFSGTKIHVIITIVGLLLTAVSATTAFTLSAMADVPSQEAALVVSVHSEHPMETKDFMLFINGNIEYAGSTGERSFVRIVLHYVWDTMPPLQVNIVIVSDSGLYLESASVSLLSGEIYSVNFYL